MFVSKSSKEGVLLTIFMLFLGCAAVPYTHASPINQTEVSNENNDNMEKIGPTNIYPTGHLWLCLKNVVVNIDCHPDKGVGAGPSGNAAENTELPHPQCAEDVDSVIQITPAARTLGRFPYDKDASETCVKVY